MADSGWRVTTRGFSELQASFRDAPRKIADVGRTWAKDVAADEVKYIQAAAPSKTGRFRQTITPYSRAFVVGIYLLPYPKLGLKLADWIIKGTPAHIIRARRADALHFVWKGKEVFFKFVRHPGTSPNDFITKGSKKFDSRLQFWYRQLEQRVVKAMGLK